MPYFEGIHIKKCNKEEIEQTNFLIVQGEIAKRYHFDIHLNSNSTEKYICLKAILIQ